MSAHRQAPTLRMWCPAREGKSLFVKELSHIWSIWGEKRVAPERLGQQVTRAGELEQHLGALHRPQCKPPQGSGSTPPFPIGCSMSFVAPSTPCNGNTQRGEFWEMLFSSPGRPAHYKATSGCALTSWHPLGKIPSLHLKDGNCNNFAWTFLRLKRNNICSRHHA